MFRKLQDWAKNVWITASSPARYKELRSRPLSQGIKYLYVLLLALSFLFTLKIVVALLVARPAIGHFMEEVKREVPALYPEELVLTLSGGKLSTNVEEPYTIELPMSWRKSFEDPDAPAHLVTIDTQAHIEDFERYDSFVLATKTALVLPDREKGGYRVITFERLNEEQGPLVIDQATYLAVTGRMFSYFVYLPLLLGILALLLLLLFPFAMAGSLLLWFLFYLLSTTLFSWILARIMKVPLRYKELYRIGCFALTLPILVSIPLSILGIKLPLAFTLVFFIFLGFIFREFKGERSMANP